MGPEDLQLLIKGIVFSLRQQKLLTKAESEFVLKIIERKYLELIGFVFISYEFKKNGINFNYSIIDKNNRDYYAAVFKGIGKMALIILGIYDYIERTSKRKIRDRIICKKRVLLRAAPFCSPINQKSMI